MGGNSLSRRALTAVLVVSVAVIAGTAAALAASSGGAGGPFRVFAVANHAGPGSRVLLTGAIGDHGRSELVTKSGRVSNTGHYVRLVLSRGTITFKTTGLHNALGRLFRGVVTNRATCSLSVTARGTLSIVSGTGHYAGVGGSARITVAIGYIFRRRHGRCYGGTGPTAAEQIVYGTGTASF